MFSQLENILRRKKDGDVRTKQQFAELDKRDVCTLKEPGNSENQEKNNLKCRKTLKKSLICQPT